MHMLNNSRRRNNNPFPGAGHVWIPGKFQLLFGPDGVATRGRLCDHCRDAEIEKFYARRYVNGRQKTGVDVYSTCKCWDDLQKHICYRHKKDLQLRMEYNSDRLAGQGGWLEHIEYDPVRQRAVYVQANAPLVARKLAAGMSSNACRCGRDVPAGPPIINNSHLNTQRPITQCTSCSGVVVFWNDPLVLNWQADDRRDGPGRELNMALGRPLPRV